MLQSDWSRDPFCCSLLQSDWLRPIRATLTTFVLYSRDVSVKPRGFSKPIIVTDIFQPNSLF